MRNTQPSIDDLENADPRGLKTHNSALSFRDMVRGDNPTSPFTPFFDQQENDDDVSDDDIAPDEFLNDERCPAILLSKEEKKQM